MELALTAIFQNEAPYLKEWIDFHRLMGFEYFDLFDHMSTDSPETVLKPYIDQGIVRLTRWPLACNDVYEWTEVQCLAYERAIHWAKSKWLAILDIDEFLFPVEGTLLDALKPFEAFGGICVNWQLYGTSNVAKIPDGKLIETLNWKAPKLQVGNQHVKSIVRPERVKGFDNAHSAIYKDGFFQVNTKMERFEGCISPTVEIDLLRINHYTVRDEHYLLTQKIPRLEKWWPKERKSIEAWKAHFNAMNLVEDRLIHRFLDQ
ncbi:MAG: glycosyltransferase family 92 protein [Parachlamydiales bacterium]|nr:glycosyltransferase family 92 protein [Parachlamydiales bacterium]